MGSMAGGGLSLGTLWVNVAADVDAAVKSLQDFGKTVGDEIDEQKKKWDGLKTTGESLSKVGTSLTAGLTLPIVGIGAASISAASDFESSLNKITAVGGQTGAELETLRAQAMKLGADTKYSAQEAAEGMGNLAAAGFDTTKIMGAMPGVLDLAAAGELSVARAAEVTSDTLSQFGLAADDAGRVADVFAQGAAASSISVAQMAESMKYAGPIAQSAGVSLEAVATATALLGNAGIKGEQAGTSLRGIISSLISPSDAAATAMETLGIKATDSAGKMLPLDNIFAQLKTTGATTADMFTIFGQNAASAAAALTQNAGPAWAKMTEEIGKSDGAAKKMADTLNTGLAGGFEQMKGSLDTVLIALGTTLLPIMTNLVKAGTEFINNWILPAVKWFGELPGPVQNVAIAIAAVAAAIGPLLLVAGTMISSFATVAPVLAAAGTALAGVTAATLAVPLAIAAVTAALVALGVWIYSNWDAIVAVLSTAWDGVKEAWGAVWGIIGGALTAVWGGYMALWHTIWDPVIAVVLKVWDAVAPYFTAVWNGIASFLGGVWDGIRATASAVWSAITGAIDAFLKFAEKIPGVNKLFQLDDAWKSAQKLGEETKKTGEAAKTATPQIKGAAAASAAHGDAAAVAAPKVGKLSKAAGEQAAQTVVLAKATREFIPPARSIGEVIEDMHKKIVPATTALYNMGVEAKKNEQKVIDMKMPTVELGDYMKATFGPAAAASAAALQTVGDKAVAAKPDVVILQEALAALGLEGGKKLADLSADAAAAYKTIVASDQATQFQKDSAFIKLLEAEQAAMKANGLEVPAAHQRMLDDMRAKTGNPTTGLPATTNKFAEFGTQVSTIITNFAQDISKSLWDGNTSWGEKGKALLSSLGQAVSSTFIEPATKAISDFMSGAIKSLLGGEGLGGVFDSIKNIGSTVSGIFGGGAKAAGGAASAAGGAGSAAGGAGGALGSAGSMLSSITGIVGAVGSVGTMISSIVFGMKQEKDMDTLADHTLRTFNEIANLRIDEWVRWGDFLMIKDDLLQRLNSIMDTANLSVLKFDDMITRLTWIAEQSVYTSQILDSILASADVRGEREESMLARMLATVERIAVSSDRAVTMNLYGTDPSLVGGRVAQQLRLQGGFA
jgi:TP901 family phage tail tape measure protein